MEVYVKTLPDTLDLPEQYEVPYPEQYFKLPTLIAAVGPRGKGKTYNLSLWNKWMFDNGFFTRLYAIDPTYESNDSVKILPLRLSDLYTDVNTSLNSLADIESKILEEAAFHKEMTEEYGKKYQEYLDVERNISKMDQGSVRYLREKMAQLNEYYDMLEEELEQMKVKCKCIQYVLANRERSPYLAMEIGLGRQFDDMHPWFPAPPKLVRPAPLLFLDDLSHTELYSPSRSNPLNNLTLRHRHLGGQGYGVTIEFSVQTFKTGVTKALRENTQQFLLFATRDNEVVEGMYSGLGSHCTFDEFLMLYNHATADPHGFLLVDNNTKDKNRTFRKGWDTFLVNFIDYESKKIHVQKTTTLPSPLLNNEKEEQEQNNRPKKKRRKK